MNKMAEGVGFINVVRFMSLGTTSSEKQKCSKVLFKARNSYFDRLETNNFASASTKKKIKTTSRRVELLELDSCAETRSISHNGSSSSGSISTITKIGEGTATNDNKSRRVELLELGSCAETHSISHNGSSSSGSISTITKIGEGTATNDDNTQMPVPIEKKVRFDDRLVNIEIPHNQKVFDEGTAAPITKPNLKPTGYRRAKRSSTRRETKKSFYDRMASTETIASASLKIGYNENIRKRSSSVPASRSRYASRSASKKLRSRSSSRSSSRLRSNSNSTFCTSLKPQIRPTTA